MQHFRVILLDQRGTGRSSPITTASLLRVGDARAQAEYLAYFRWATYTSWRWPHLLATCLLGANSFATLPKRVKPPGCQCFWARDDQPFGGRNVSQWDSPLDRAVKRLELRQPEA